MKVLVPVKRVIDFNVKVRVKADQSGVDLANVKMSMNPFDEIAVEEAVRLKKKGKATEVIVAVHRPAASGGHDPYRPGDGRRPRHPGARLTRWSEPLAVAKILKAIVEAEQPGLVITGKQAIDDDANQVGQMLAALLGWPQAHLRPFPGAGRRQRQDHPRDRWRLADRGGEAPGGDDHRPAPQRAALCLAAQHHEGQEEAASVKRPPPNWAWM